MRGVIHSSDQTLKTMQITYLQRPIKECWDTVQMIKATTIGGLSIDNQSINHLKINDQDELSDFIDRCKMQGYYEITKQMFDEFFIENTKYVNEISKL